VIIAQQFSKWKKKKVTESSKIKDFANIEYRVDNVDKTGKKSIQNLKTVGKGIK